MRVVHMADYGGPHAGSFIPMLTALAAEVRRAAGSLEIVLPTRARGRRWLDDLESAQITVLFLDAIPLRRTLPAVRRLIGAGHETIVHTHFTAFDVVAALAAIGTEAEVVWHIHTSPPSGRRDRWRGAVKHRVVAQRVRVVLCVAEHIAEELGRRGSGQSRFLPNGISLRQFPPVTGQERARQRRRLGLREDWPVALHFGRDWKVKGGDLFLGAVAQLCGADTPLHALVLRGGEPLRAEAARLGISDFVHSVDSIEDIRDLYAAADIFASTSRHEGMPFTVLEALACGVEVVATAIPGHRAIADRCPGIALAALDPASIAVAMTKILEHDPRESAAQLSSARAWIEAHASVEAWASAVVRIYQEITFREGRSGGRCGASNGSHLAETWSRE